MQPLVQIRSFTQRMIGGGYVWDVLRGTGWNGLYKIFASIIVIGKMFVLARLLTPEDFGVFSLILIALGMMEAMTETGINITILQSKHSIKYFLDTAWVIAIARGFVIGIFMILAGFGMRWFYDDPQLLFLVAVAALVPVIKGFINPAIVRLQKELRFLSDSVYRLSLVIFETLGMILGVLLLENVMGLIVGLILAAVMEVAVSFFFFKHRPVFNLIPSRARTIFENAKGLTVTAFLSYVQENVDNLITGKITGTRVLGLYDRGYALTHKVSELTRSVFHSTVPVYVKLTHDTARLRRAVLKASIPTVLLVSAAIVPFLFLPELVVEIILGDQWLEIIPFVPVLAIGVWLQTMSMLARSLLLSVKSYRFINIELLLGTVALVGFLLWLTPLRGLEGAVMSVVLSRAISLPVVLWGAYRRLQISRSGQS
jgi:O-antigen/teichoic acid export membrane protein